MSWTIFCSSSSGLTSICSKIRRAMQPCSCSTPASMCSVLIYCCPSWFAVRTASSIVRFVRGVSRRADVAFSPTPTAF